ncbi:hypothetical protein [Thauera butanivorans]|uniref:hypothetical protein n=1 Tax=Thauera butanivorans TaxID=86174 RepID=UPI000B0E6EA0|nr:hypothetical protein [Thauera butanivorans]
MSTPASPAPACCQRCVHLVTLHTADTARTACLRALPLSAACGWWRPRQPSFADTRRP